jgi:GTP-binding protein HflX
VFGKIHGLKASQIHALERLFQRRLGSRQALPPEIAKSMADIAADTGRMVALLVDRRGSVEEVALGDAKVVYLPDIGRHRAGPGRLRGLRLLVAQPVKAPHAARMALDLPKDLITDLERLKLDALVYFEALPDGQLGRAALAHVVPERKDGDAGDQKRHQVLDFRRVHDITIDFDGFIADLESELAKKTETLRDPAIEHARDRAVLVGAYTKPRHEIEASMAELKELARTAGVYVTDVIIQKRSQLDSRTIVGKGKLEEICLGALHKGADLLIFDLDLTPSQLNAITDLTDLRVLDRTMLILDIFARRATTKGGRMQVELAQAKYSFPRLAKKQEGLSRLTGGIGGTGPGETKLEVDRRRLKDRITRLERDVEKLSEERQIARKRRNVRGVPVISIVGYTNAGKSTLLNALTGADVVAEDMLFATLDPTSRRLRFPEEREVVIVDTVGFIRDLPESLVNAFRATLEELHDADLLLHVVDVSDPRKEQQMESVDRILDDLELTETPRLLVMNKADRIDEETRGALERRTGGVCVSATERIGFEALLNRAAEILWREDATATNERWGERPSRQRYVPDDDTPSPETVDTSDEGDASESGVDA